MAIGNVEGFCGPRLMRTSFHLVSVESNAVSSLALMDVTIRDFTQLQMENDPQLSYLNAFPQISLISFAFPQSLPFLCCYISYSLKSINAKIQNSLLVYLFLATGYVKRSWERH